MDSVQRAMYRGGQEDVLDLLADRRFYDDEDRVVVTFGDDALGTDYCLWCLSHNLTVAAGLERAFELGEARNSHRTCALEGPTDCPWFWSPGCGREAPR